MLLSIFSNKKKVRHIDKIANKKILYGAKPKLPKLPNKKLMRK
tara:strand:+ start:567 stop:695 length:129 start_codon:yes stop_codon:yes gene_type:complete